MNCDVTGSSSESNIRPRSVKDYHPWRLQSTFETRMLITTLLNPKTINTRPVCCVVCLLTPSLSCYQIILLSDRGTSVNVLSVVKWPAIAGSETCNFSTAIWSPTHYTVCHITSRLFSVWHRIWFAILHRPTYSLLIAYNYCVNGSHFVSAKCSIIIRSSNTGF